MEEQEKIEFSKEALDLVKRMMGNYPEGKHKSAILPILHLAQAEFGGWLSPKTMDYVAGILNIQPIEVYEVASFYSMFNLQPVGKCVIEVCRTGPCWLVGAEDIIKYLEEKLQIKVGDTTPDGMFTLKTVECLAACGCGPVMQVGETYHEYLSFPKLDTILENYRSTTNQPISHWSKDKIKQ